MNDSRVLSIEAAVDANEAPIVTCAAAAIGHALSDAQRATVGAAQAPWSCSVRFHAHVSALPPLAGRHGIVVTSLLPWLAPADAPWPQLEHRIRSTFAVLCAGGTPVFVFTILRHVEQRASDPGADRDETQRIRIRIRRLNLLVAEVSRQFGVLVVDLDRILADIGALRLGTDYRLSGEQVREVAGNHVARCIIANTFDDLLTPELQARARELLVAKLPAIEKPPGATSSHLWTVGQGVRKQTVAMTEHVQRSEFRWLLQQVRKRRLSPLDALRRVLAKIGQRGVRHSARRVGGVLVRLVGIRR